MGSAGDLLSVAGGLALLYFGGEALVRGASSLALRHGISPLSIGLTVVAFGTSLPELVVSLDAALSGANDIAVGNVVGSNICNVALILGVAVLLRPATVEARMARIDTPLLIVASAVVVGMLGNDRISRGEGLALVLGLVGFTVLAFRGARREPEEVRRELAEAAAVRPHRTPVEALRVVLGLLLLVGGAHLLVSGAVRLATALGVSQALIALTIVALGTSLPELATSVIAARRGHGDIAVGNVVGSNLFNLLGILGVTALVRPLARGDVGWLDLGTMMLLPLALLPLLRTRPTLGRAEGVLLLLCYAAYLGVSIAT